MAAYGDPSYGILDYFLGVSERNMLLEEMLNGHVILTVSHHGLWDACYRVGLLSEGIEARANQRGRRVTIQFGHQLPWE